MIINKAEPEPGRARVPRAGDSQVEVAVKALLRLIWVNGLGPGDRLPTHWELCRRIGVSTHSLTPAMRRLVGAGVLARKPKAGTVVIDPDAYREPLWRVGVAENFETLRGASPFFSVLGACVQNELVRGGCWPRLYLRQMPTERHSDALADYPRLAADAASGLLDAAICLGNLDRGAWRRVAGNAPLCGFNEVSECGAQIDLRTMVREAVRCLAAQGARRVAVVRKARHPAERDLRAGFSEGLAVAGLRPQTMGNASAAPKASATLTNTVTHMMAGARVAQSLLALPAARRPDGLIVLDDYMAAGLTAVLREGGGYRPRIAVVTHLQAPQVYALPVLRFELDIAELARRGVAILAERLRNPDLPGRVEWVAPRLLARQELSFPDIARYGAVPEP